jgi:hypothetical protein
LLDFLRELAALERVEELDAEPAEAPPDLDRPGGAIAFAFFFAGDVFIEDALAALPVLAVFLLGFTLVGIRSL